MKYFLPRDISRKHYVKSHQIRKLKMALIACGLSVLLAVIFTVWVAAASMNYISRKVQEVIHAPVAQAHIGSLQANLQAELNSLPVRQNTQCWERAQNLLTANFWLEKSILENWLYLKEACLDKKTVICKTHNCIET